MRGRLVAVAVLVAVGVVGGAVSWVTDPAGSARPVVRPSPSPAPRDLLERGTRLAAAGRPDAAADTFRQALAIAPTDPYAWCALGYLAQVRGDGAAAAADYDKALAADPGYLPALYNRAILLEQSDVDGAAALYRRVLTGGATPGSAVTGGVAGGGASGALAASAHLRLGYLLDRAGDARAARAEFAAAAAIDPALTGSVPAGYRTGTAG